MISPSSGVVTQGFSGSHPAVDYAYNGGGSTSYGQPIVAPEAGRVTYVGQMGTGVNDAGTVVQIVAGARTHRLCHLIPSSPTVGANQQVSMGQVVGQMGYSGYVIPAGMAGSHLHWVMEINGLRVDGRQYINEKIGGDDMIQNNDSEFERWWKLHRRIRGEGFSRDYFNKGFVGQSAITMIDRIQNDPQADYREYAGDIGNLAIKQDWLKVIEDLKAGGNIPQAKIDNLIKEAEEAVAAAKKLKE